MILIVVDFLVKIYTILLSFFIVGESTSLKTVISNVTAIWFLDNINKMCANSILASIDTFAPDIV